MSKKRVLKIAFIEVPQPWLVRKYAQVPLGPLYLGTILKKEGHDVSLCRPNDIEEMKTFIDHDIIAFSGTSLESKIVEQYVSGYKQMLGRAKVWYGGPHVTAMKNEKGTTLFNNKSYDSFCFGEGENIIIEMANDVINGEAKRFYEASCVVDNLDDICFPDRNLIQGEHGGDIFSFGEKYIGTDTENFITSRGCPYSCSFCASGNMWGRKVRYRSVGNCIQEIKDIINTHNCRQFKFIDDNLTTNRARLIEMLKELKKLDVIWRCSARADNLDYEICEKMYAAGCREVSPGIESGDKRVLNFLGKKSDVDKMLTGCKNATESGIKVRALFMIGTPGERSDTPEINKDFIDKLSYHAVTLSTFVPLPGTAIWQNPEKYNCEIVTRNFDEYNKDFWVFDENTKEKKKRKYVPLIRNKFLTLEQQISNVNRMEEYILKTNSVNLG